MNLKTVRLQLRFLLPLAATLIAAAYLAAPLMDQVTLRWFSRDLNSRGALVANALSDSLAEALLSNKVARLQSLFDRTSQDERLFAIGLCSPEGKLLQKTDRFPSSLSCVAALELSRHAESTLALTGGAFTTDLPDGAGGRSFDPTGLVKGWAVDRASEYLAGLAGVSWCVNAGGDVLAGRHRHVPPLGPDAAPWRIGVENPRDRAQIARVVPLECGAVATSGTAARGAHLYDPATGSYAARDGSSTVIGPTLLWADIWATALFVGGAAARERFDAQRDYAAFDL